MIEKLKRKVSLIITLSISSILIGIILIFAILNYNNTIDVSVSTFDRFNDLSKIKNIPQEQMDMNEESIKIEWENTYSFIIDNGKIVEGSKEKNEELENYAIKVANKKNEKGIIKNYVYRVKNTKDGKTVVLLIKDDNVINRIKIICVFTILGMMISIIITYIISKKISSMIVKPVEETVKKQKQFISDASHELKTPLAVIEANVDVLESQIGDSKWINYIQSEINSMDKLINNLLFLAKVENVKEQKTKEVFNLSKEVQMVNSMFESMAHEKKINLKNNIQEDISFNGNKEDIKQVLSVLVENAIMHTKEEGKVIIELVKEKNNIIIQVKNEGEAIPEVEQKKIFERFYRIDKSRDRSEKRYGLVISIACTVTLAIRNTADRLVKNYEQSNDIIASISFDRGQLQENFKGGEDAKKENIETFNNIESFTVEDVKKYGESEYLKKFYYDYVTSLNSDTLTKAADQVEYEVEDTQTSTTTSTTTSGEPSNLGGKGSGGGMSYHTNTNTTTVITKSKEIFQNSRNLTGDFELDGYSSYDGMTEFINGTYTVIQGEMTSGFENFECVINEELATLNEVSVGETITLKNPTTNTNLDQLENATKSIENVKTFATTFLVITLIISAIVLFVINMINIRERKYEIGVYRTIGVSKIKLTMQFVLELLIVTIVFLCIGTTIGTAISKDVGNSLLANEIEETKQSQEQVQNNFGRKDMTENFNGMVEVETIDTIDAVVDYQVLLELFGIGIALTLVSSLASMISIQKFSPLTILKERS